MTDVCCFQIPTCALFYSYYSYIIITNALNIILVTILVTLPHLKLCILFVHLLQMLLYLPYTIKQRRWEGWAHKPVLTHLSLMHSPGPFVVLYVRYQRPILHFLISSIVNLFILLYLIMKCFFIFFILLHD